MDGDTLHVEVDLGCDIQVRLTLRLAGINAPEMSTPAGKVAKDWLQIALVAASGQGFNDLVLRTVKDKREKYGRYLAHIWTVGDGVFTDWGFATDVPSLNERMVVAGQAVAYAG